MQSDIWFGVDARVKDPDFRTIKVICHEAEEQGFDLFTIPDHFMHARPHNELVDEQTPENNTLECWTTLAGLSAVTTRIKLGSLVTCYGYRAPTVLAKMATTVDIISGGRLMFGIGAGWYEEEFISFMGRFPPAGERLKGLEETVEICSRMFTSERTTYSGKLYKVNNVLNSPQPVQKPIPIMIAGGGEKRTLKIVAKQADISHFFARDLETIERKLSILRRHCKAVGRDYNEIRKGIGFGLSLGRTKAEAHAKLKMTAKILGSTPEALTKKSVRYGTSEEVVNALKNYTDMGFGLFTFTLYPYPMREDIEVLSKEIIPLLF